MVSSPFVTEYVGRMKEGKCDARMLCRHAATQPSKFERYDDRMKERAE